MSAAGCRVSPLGAVCKAESKKAKDAEGSYSASLLCRSFALGSYATIRAAWFKVASAAGRKNAAAKARLANLVLRAVVILSALQIVSLFDEEKVGAASAGRCDRGHGIRFGLQRTPGRLVAYRGLGLILLLGGVADANSS